MKKNYCVSFESTREVIDVVSNLEDLFNILKGNGIEDFDEDMFSADEGNLVFVVPNPDELDYIDNIEVSW